MRPDVIHIAVTCADGHDVAMQFIKTVNPQWTRKGTDQEIAGEIEKLALNWPETWKPVRGWRRIEPDEAAGISAAMRKQASETRAARRARRRSIPIAAAADEETVARLEAAAATVNAAAANADAIETVKYDLRQLAIVVQELSGVVAAQSQRPDGELPTVDLSGLESDIKVLADQLSADRMLHDEASRRLTGIEGGLSALIARMDDLYAWHDRLAGQVNTMASYRPDRRVQPPADLPPPPPTGEMQHSWVKGLADISEDDPLPEGPEMTQDGQENEPASDHAQQVNVVREPRTAAEPANQHLTIEETRHLTVEDRWAKPFARYQIAQQAINGSVANRRLLQGPAERRNVSIDDLARQIVADWKAAEQQIMDEF